MSAPDDRPPIAAQLVRQLLDTLPADVAADPRGRRFRAAAREHLSRHPFTFTTTEPTRSDLEAGLRWLEFHGLLDRPPQTRNPRPNGTDRGPRRGRPRPPETTGDHEMGRQPSPDDRTGASRP